MTSIEHPADTEGWPHPPAIDDGGARHLVKGRALPRTALTATSRDPVALGAVPGTIVVFVFPWAGRPGHPNPPDWDTIPGAHGSTPELLGIANLYTAFRSLKASVFAVSGQAPDDQLELATRLALPFPLLSDSAGTLRDALRLPTFETGGVRYLSRMTLIGRAGVIERVFYPVHPPHTHPRAVLAGTAAMTAY
jgi:peroxiredoxin